MSILAARIAELNKAQAQDNKKGNAGRKHSGDVDYTYNREDAQRNTNLTDAEIDSKLAEILARRK